MKETLTLSDFSLIIRNINTTIQENSVLLCQLDSVVGDGDHGTTLARGLGLSIDAIIATPPATISDLFQTVGKTMISSMGGASGPIFGSLFKEMGRASKGFEVVTLSDLYTMFSSAAIKVQTLGKAEPGDKTLLDSLLPGIDSLAESVEHSADFVESLQKMAQAAQAGVEATKEMTAKKGRARYAGERGLGRQDAGATSVYLMLQSFADTVVDLGK